MSVEKCSVFRDGDNFDVTITIDFIKGDIGQKIYFAFDRKLKKYVFKVRKNSPDRYVFYTCKQNADLLNTSEWYTLFSTLEQMHNATETEVVSMQINRHFKKNEYKKFANERNIIPLSMFKHLEQVAQQLK